ncbi:MAG: DUF2892 domain-containing protein [Gammaproteobacteria bacterium]|nr:DUF2892 domain-containing protein [Gammaproteobacteria bacterium]
MGPNTKLHDGIIGALFVVGAFLAFFVNIKFVLLLGIIGAVMLQSAFTGFCPIYYTLGIFSKK